MNISTISNALSTGNVATAEKQDLSQDFLRLLTKQLQSQDPLNPLSNSDFTSQLAQINSLNQLSELNQNFQTFFNSMGSAGFDSLVGASELVGKTVLVDINNTTDPFASLTTAKPDGSDLFFTNTSLRSLGENDRVSLEFVTAQGEVKSSQLLDSTDNRTGVSLTREELTTALQQFSATDTFGGVRFRINDTQTSSAFLREQVQSVSLNGSTVSFQMNSNNLWQESNLTSVVQ